MKTELTKQQMSNLGISNNIHETIEKFRQKELLKKDVIVLAWIFYISIYVSLYLNNLI